MSYCDFCAKLPDNDLHREYHDTQYGFPITDDNALFGRLILEINQAGLSWGIILKKQENFRQAFHFFNIQRIASFNELDVERLLGDAGIVRNKLKINAVIHNAKEIVKIQQEYGTFKNWLDNHSDKSIEDWVKLFRRTFKFVGGEIVVEFLMSAGYVKGAHSIDCPVHIKVLELKPKWTEL